jgi:hypothetical protein
MWDLWWTKLQSIKLLSLGEDMENYENPMLYDTKHWSVTGMVFITVLDEI